MITRLFSISEKPCYINKNSFTLQGKGNYNSALMSKHNRIQRLPLEVDPFRLVGQGQTYEGKIPLGDYPRLKELLHDAAGEALKKNLIDVKLEFTRTETGLPVVRGDIATTLGLPCQRCLKAETVPFETRFEVVLVSSDEQAERLQSGYDTWLVEEQKMFLQDFIEDEILLALPPVVMHDECDAPKELIEALPSDLDEEDEETQQKKNPFAVLKDLKLN